MNAYINGYTYNNSSRNVLVDHRIAKDSIKTLESLGFNVFKTKPVNELSKPVCGHPDMTVYNDNGILICEPQVYEFIKNITSMPVKCGKTILKENYPLDIAYNVCRLKNHVIGAFDHTDPVILENILQAGAIQINVNQGYSKCSISIVSDRAIITADADIYKKATGAGIDVLKISEGHITLEGYDYGFIGGATGLLNNKLWIINGELKTHPDADKIKNFVTKYNKTIIELKKSAIEDVGTIMQI